MEDVYFTKEMIVDAVEYETWEQPFLLANVGYPTVTVGYVAGCNLLV